MAIKKTKILNLLTAFLWVLVGAGCITLLLSAMHNKQSKVCQSVEINIFGVSNNFFIDKSDVYAIIKNFGGDSTKKQALSAINLKQIEAALERDVWVKNAELFFDNNNILKVSVEEREPIARIFTTSGGTFYIDSSCKILPLSNKFSARLPVFTGFTTDTKILSSQDSSLLNDIKNITQKIIADTFLVAMIEQIDITQKNNFEMVPKLGKQRIIFGDATDADLKFAKLKLFYKEVITKAGWNRYSNINLQYKNQVVASIRGKEDVVADSLKTMLMMKFIVADATRRSADSSLNFVQDTNQNTADSSIIQQSMERDDEGVATSQTEKINTNNPIKPTVVTPSNNVKSIIEKPTNIVANPAVKTTTAKPVTVAKPTATVSAKPTPTKVVVKKVIVKPIVKPVTKPTTQKPKIIMKPTNEY